MKILNKYLTFMLLLIFLTAVSCSSSKNVKSVKAENHNGSYQPDTVVYSLNMLSNILFAYVGEGSGLEDTAKATIQKVLNDKTTDSLIGEWSIAWGPAVFTKDTKNHEDSCVADNLLVLFQKGANNSSKAPEFVLATSGTNSVSDFGWFTEDFTFNEMVKWQLNVYPDSISINTNTLATKEETGSVPCLALGTAEGLNALLRISSDGKNIVQGLRDAIGKVETPTELRVVGHSLGGTLAPTLALALSEGQDSWAPGLKVKISTAPTAGASPGNYKFRDHFFSVIDTANFYGKMNDMDLVPHGYEGDLLTEVPTLYSQYQDIGVPCIIQNLINCVQRDINNSFGSNVYASLYTYESLATDKSVHFSEPFVEMIKGDTATAIGSACWACNKGACDLTRFFKPELARLVLLLFKDYPKTKDALNCGGTQCDEIIPTYRYVAEVGYQHVEAYYEKYGIQEFIHLMNCNKSWYGKKDCKEDKEMKDADYAKYITVLNALENFIEKLDCN